MLFNHKLQQFEEWRRDSKRENVCYKSYANPIKAACNLLSHICNIQISSGRIS